MKYSPKTGLIYKPFVSQYGWVGYLAIAKEFYSNQIGRIWVFTN